MPDTDLRNKLQNRIKLLEIQLEQARSSPATISSKTIHDLNGTLAVAQGQAHMALLNISANSKALVNVEEICKAVQKALIIVDQLYENIQQLNAHSTTPTPTPTSTTPPDRDWHGKGTILFVDDEENMRSMINGVLKHYGYQVLLANDGDQALELFKKSHEDIHLVFMDMTMPRVNGLEAFTLMRQIDAAIPIVMTSGYSEVNLAEKWPELGMNGFLRKPCDLQTLLLTIKHCIRS
jgi:CheY-like chemotaxis protein